MALLLNQFGAPLHGGKESFTRVTGNGALIYAAHGRNAYDGTYIHPLTSASPSFEWLNINGERFLRPNGGATDLTNLGVRPTTITPANYYSSAFIARIYCHQSTSETTKAVALVTNGSGGYAYGIRSNSTNFNVAVNQYWFFTGYAKTPGTIYTIGAWTNGDQNGYFVDEGTSEVRTSGGSTTTRAGQVVYGDGFGLYTSQDFGVSLLWFGIGHYTEHSVRGIARDPYRYLFRRDEPYFTPFSVPGVPTLSAATVTNIQSTTVTPRVTVTF